MVCTDESKYAGTLSASMVNGHCKRCSGTEDRIRTRIKGQMEPHLSDTAVAALYAPTGGIVCPFELNIALAENACMNGVAFIFMQKWIGYGTSGGREVHTESGHL